MKIASSLDIFVKNDQVMTTFVFRKSTFTGLITNYESFTADSYKIGLVKSLLLRAFRISGSWSIFHKELERIYKILQQNSSPKFLIDQIVSSFITKHVKKIKNSPVASNKAAEEVSYFKRFYIGKIFESLQNKMGKTSASFCKSSKVMILFAPFKIVKYFSQKDPIPKEFASWVVYKF